MKLAFGIGIGIFIANKLGGFKNLVPPFEGTLSNPLNALINKPITPLTKNEVLQVSEASRHAEKVYDAGDNYSKSVVDNISSELNVSPDILLMSLEESI